MAAQSGEFAPLDLSAVLELVGRFARGMWRHRWTGLIVAWGTAVSLWVAICLMPNTYEASARVFVNTETLLRPLLRGLAVETDIASDVAIMTRALVSRPNLERVAREIDLDVTATSNLEYEALLRSIEERVTISPSQENVYEIRFSDSSRDRAISMVDALLDSFVENTLGAGQEDSAQAERALRAEIEDYEKRLIEAEERLKEFKRTNVGMMPNERGDYYQQLQAASADLATAEQALKVALQRRTAIQRQLEGEEPVFGIMSGTFGGRSRATSYDGQIAALEQKLANLLVEFTDRHPEVVRSKALIQELIVKREAERASAPPSSEIDPVASMLDMNPVYQNLKIQLGTIEVELATLRGDVEERRAEAERLRRLVDVIPQIEAELNQLNRDYDVVRDRHTEMSRRWEDLQTAQRVGTGTDQVRFRIIEPPFAATKPAGPPRPLFAIAAFIVALGAGLGVTLVLDLVRPVYSSSSDLRVYALPILGTVSRHFDDFARGGSRKETLGFAGFAVALFALAIGVIVFANAGAEALQRALAA